MKQLAIFVCLLVVLGTAVAVIGGGTAIGQGRAPSLVLSAVEQEPANGRTAVGDATLAKLATAIVKKPKDRGARFALISALMASGKFADAKRAAIEWRAVDAYNLVVVRLLGDIYAEQGNHRAALRTYSAVVELLAKDVRAQRALASVLKQSGDVASAYARLREANRLKPGDRRLLFELGDAAERLGNLAEAKQSFETIVSDEEVNESIRYPAKQRLAQVYAAQRRIALHASEREKAESLSAAIDALKLKGGADNDIKIYLSWDTDRSDVDLWITNPSGEKVFYEHKTGKFGGTLYRDVTNGYGPESFTAHRAHRGTYTVEVNYYSAGRSNFPEARGEVVVVLNEGRADEKKHVLPYRLFAAKQVVNVATIAVN